MNDLMWQAISLIAGCVTTAMTLLYTRERQKRREQPGRIDALLDGYEKLIRDNDHKSRMFDKLKEAYDDLEAAFKGVQADLNKAQGIMQQMKEELDYSRSKIDALNEQLITFKQKLAES